VAAGIEPRIDRGRNPPRSLCRAGAIALPAVEVIVGSVLRPPNGPPNAPLLLTLPPPKNHHHHRENGGRDPTQLSVFLPRHLQHSANRRRGVSSERKAVPPPLAIRSRPAGTAAHHH